MGMCRRAGSESTHVQLTGFQVLLPFADLFHQLPQLRGISLRGAVRPPVLAGGRPCAFHQAPHEGPQRDYHAGTASGCHLSSGVQLLPPLLAAYGHAILLLTLWG